MKLHQREIVERQALTSRKVENEKCSFGSGKNNYSAINNLT